MLAVLGTGFNYLLSSFALLGANIGQSLGSAIDSLFSSKNTFLTLEDFGLGSMATSFSFLDNSLNKPVVNVSLEGYVNSAISSPTSISVSDSSEIVNRSGSSSLIGTVARLFNSSTDFKDLVLKNENLSSLVGRLSAMYGSDNPLAKALSERFSVSTFETPIVETPVIVTPVIEVPVTESPVTVVSPVEILAEVSDVSLDISNPAGVSMSDNWIKEAKDKYAKRNVKNGFASFITGLSSNIPVVGSVVGLVVDSVESSLPINTMSEEEYIEYYVNKKRNSFLNNLESNGSEIVSGVSIGSSPVASRLTTFNTYLSSFLPNLQERISNLSDLGNSTLNNDNGNKEDDDKEVVTSNGGFSSLLAGLGGLSIQKASSILMLLLLVGSIVLGSSTEDSNNKNKRYF